MILSIGLGALMAYLCIFESLRFYVQHQACIKRYEQNDIILGDPTCWDPIEMHKRGHKAREMCERAQHENTISPLSCAFQHMWTNGALYQVWNMMTDHYLKVAGVLVPCCMLTIFMLFWSCQQKAERQERKEMMGMIREISAGKIEYHPQKFRSTREARYERVEL